MGLVIGVIMGFLGIAALLIPLIIDFYVSRKQSDTNYQRALEASSGMILVAMILMIGGLVLVGIVSVWDVGKSGAGSLAGEFKGNKGSGGSSGGNNNELLTYLLLNRRAGATEGTEGTEGVEGAEGAEAAEGGGAIQAAEEAAEFA